MALRFRPDIEGLRALAIVPVVLFHASPSMLPGGYVGVDVFFVISGYLITALLMQRLVSGRYSVVSFYGARVRRIFPALFVMLALVTPLAVWLLPPADLRDFGQILGATAVFFSNMALYGTAGYFDTATELKPLVHTWSLAVEEQYYIVFPVLLASLFKRWRKGIVPVLTVIALISLLLSIWWLRYDPALSFYSAVSRTFELLIGSLLAVRVWVPGASQVWREVAAWAGLLLIVLSCVWMTPQTNFPGTAALLPCAGAGLLIWAGSGVTVTRVGKWLAAAPLRWLGAMSFSLYLWHWPVLVFTRHWVLGEPEAWQRTTAVALAVLLAWASLRWVEAPVRRAAVSDKRLLTGGAVCIALSLATASVLTEAGPSMQALSPQEKTLYAGALDVNPARRQCHGRIGSPIPYSQRCRFGDEEAGAQVAVWADSHGAELALALGEKLGHPGHSVAQITASSCPPALGFEPPSVPLCQQHNQETLSRLLEDSSVGTVVLVARWNWYLNIDPLAFEEGMARSVRALSQAGRQVILVEPFPEYPYPVPAALGALSRRGELDRAEFGQTLSDYRRDNSRALSLITRLSSLPRVSVVSAAAVFCADGRCKVMSPEGRPYYFDNNHLSMTGARQLAAALNLSD